MPKAKTKAELQAELTAAYHGLDGIRAAFAAALVKRGEVESLVARVIALQQDSLVTLALAFADVRDERDSLRVALKETTWRLERTDGALSAAIAAGRPYEFARSVLRASGPHVALDLDLDVPRRGDES